MGPKAHHALDVALPHTPIDRRPNGRRLRGVAAKNVQHIQLSFLAFGIAFAPRGGDVQQASDVLAGDKQLTHLRFGIAVSGVSFLFFTQDNRVLRPQRFNGRNPFSLTVTEIIKDLLCRLVQKNALCVCSIELFGIPCFAVRLINLSRLDIIYDVFLQFRVGF